MLGGGLVFSQDGSLLVSGSNAEEDALAIVRNTATRKNLYILRHSSVLKVTIAGIITSASGMDVHAAAITADNQILALGGEDNHVTLWRVVDGSQIGSFEVPSPEVDYRERGILTSLSATMVSC